MVLPLIGSHMKRLAFPQLSHPPPKSAAAACATPIFRACSQSHPLNLDAVKTDFIKKQSVYTDSSSYRRQMAATATGEITVSSSPAVIRLNPIEATPESFREFGQVIEASPDGDEFGPRDAQLDLSRGIPRSLSEIWLFCSMFLTSYSFSRITWWARAWTQSSSN